MPLCVLGECCCASAQCACDVNSLGLELNSSSSAATAAPFACALIGLIIDSELMRIAGCFLCLSHACTPLFSLRMLPAGSPHLQRPCAGGACAG
jgi:hypothetical protein